MIGQTAQRGRLNEEPPGAGQWSQPALGVRISTQQWMSKEGR